MLNKIWNNKISGIFSLSQILLQTFFNRLSDNITKSLFLSNIKIGGRNCLIKSGLYYRYPKSITIGNNVVFGAGISLTAEEQQNKGTQYLIIEDGASIGNKCKIDFTGGITIKKDAHVAHEVLISTHDHGFDYKSVPVGKSLEIGEHAFVGNRAMILHNCNKIGKFSVIGAGSVVTKDVPDYAVVAGNPARITKILEKQ